MEVTIASAASGPAKALGDLRLRNDTELSGNQRFGSVMGLPYPFGSRWDSATGASTPIYLGSLWHNLSVLNGNLSVEDKIEAWNLNVESDLSSGSIDAYRIKAGGDITVRGIMCCEEFECGGKITCGTLITNRTGLEIVLRSPDYCDDGEATCDSLITDRSTYDFLLRSS